MRTYDEHTPGPWFYSSGAVWADADEKIGVAQRISTSPIPAYQRDNNMRLCAASPLLLEALQLLLRRYTFQEQDDEIVRAAVAAATRSP